MTPEGQRTVRGYRIVAATATGQRAERPAGFDLTPAQEQAVDEVELRLSLPRPR